MKKIRPKTLYGIAVFFIVTVFTEGCTSNDFFGIIEEESAGVCYPKLHEIACSKEFIEFQTQSYLDMEKLLIVDTAQMVVIDTIGGRLLYASKEIGSIRPVLEARQKLVKAYPEYENATAGEKEQILNIALLNSKSLMNLARKISVNNIIRTKSVNYETDAVRWIINGSEYDLISESDAEWFVRGQYWYSDANVYNCINEALWRTEREGVERGGFGWDSDGSGILVVDPEAIINHMHRTVANVDPLPSYDFHVHPSGNLTASYEDKLGWQISPVLVHRIYDISGNYERYNMFGNPF